MTRQPSAARSRTLPPQPDIDQLRRQAKELLEAFVAGQPDAVAEVEKRSRGADAPSFALHDAQLVLARSYGFESWPKLKAHVDGVNVARLVEAVRQGDVVRVRATIEARPELVNMDTAHDDERRALHHAVLVRSPEMVRILMQHGADARKGVYPHRDATSALTLATERRYDEIVAVIEEEEQRRRTLRNAPDAAVSSSVDLLSEAIRRGEDERVMAMLEDDPASTHARDRDGRTPLHGAAATLNTQLVSWLLDHDAAADARDPDGRAPLDMAAAARWGEAGQAERFSSVAAMLRQRGAELTARSAAALGETEWLRARSAGGSLANPIDAAGGLLSIAVRHDQPEVLALLLDLGFDPDEVTRVEGLEQTALSWGMPLWHCAVLGRRAMAAMLLDRGADPNGRVYASGSPLFSAYGQRDRNMIELLERHGGAVDAVTAGLYRETRLAEKMLAGEIDGQLGEGLFAGRTVAEQLLWGAACGGSPEIVRMALDRIEWPRHDPRWYAILEQPLRHWNHRSGHQADPTAGRDTYLACFRLVLERSDANIRGRFGRTILHDIAAFERHMTAAEAVEFAATLLDAGARLDVRDDLLRSTPLGWACRWGRLPLVELFLARGADPEEREAEPWASPEAWARMAGHDDILAMLSEHLPKGRAGG